ncbi:hypothetical protein GALMADRAFT_280140 [Galerina marginata CBS 339.88]|uniref:Uncharacterized protein n=1 Tax=Galerina marginata (strain CBS 339.88) TaxID=685588 RepID=A0A067SV04_GALM3|nr:hypothetical protein GALMADRAFT_280140 [Galerina marginata CBS 339.88]
MSSHQNTSTSRSSNPVQVNLPRTNSSRTRQPPTARPLPIPPVVNTPVSPPTLQEIYEVSMAPLSSIAFMGIVIRTASPMLQETTNDLFGELSEILRLEQSLLDARLRARNLLTETLELGLLPLTQQFWEERRQIRGPIAAPPLRTNQPTTDFPGFSLNPAIPIVVEDSDEEPDLYPLPPYSPIQPFNPPRQPTPPHRTTPNVILPSPRRNSPRNTQRTHWSEIPVVALVPVGLECHDSSHKKTNRTQNAECGNPRRNEKVAGL